MLPNQKLNANYGDYLMEMLPHSIYSAVSTAHGDITLVIPRSSLKEVLLFLRDHTSCQYKSLVDICAVDYLSRSEGRFDVVYQLLSVNYNARITVKVATNELEPLDSVTSIYSSAGWYEREVWDMYGIFFSNHPDLRRILTDYGFDGHPLRRDYPLTGFTEIRYDEVEKRIVTEPLELAQEFRTFDFTSPWDQTVSPDLVETTKIVESEKKSN
jgi:NADH/F420H2 dehydrogenase subunit C